MADLEQQIVPPAYDGIDSDSAPDLVPLTKAPVVENLLVDSPGKLSMRGPISTSSIALESFASNTPISFWTLGNSVLIGYKASSADYLDPWVAPYWWWVPSTSLARAATAVTQVNLRFGTATRVTVTRDTAPGPRFAKLGDYAYGPAFDSASAAFTQGQAFWPRRLLKWGGTAAAPTAVSNAPDCGQDIVSHLNRLWVLQGRDWPSGAASPPLELNTLFYSVAGGPQATDSTTSLTAESVNSWKDFSETTQSRPRTNKIVIGADDNDIGIGLAKVGQNIVIFKRRSMYVLSGYDPTNFNVKQFSAAVGCVDARSIVQSDDGVFFMSAQGYMFFDGSRLTHVTEGMKADVVQHVLDTVATIDGAHGAYVTAVKMPNDYIALSIGRFPDTVLFSGLYCVPRRAWTRFSSEAIENGAPHTFGTGDTIPYVIAGDRLLRAEYVTAPASAPDGAYGIDTLDDTFTWSSNPADTTFSGASDTLENTDSQIEMFPSVGGAQFPIAARWQSRLFPLSTPFYDAKLHRVLVDYNAQYLDGADDQAGWTVTVQSGDGRNLADPYDVPGQGADTAYPLRRRHVRDNFAETTDAQLVIEWRQPAAPLQRAEILSAAIEFSQTHPSR